jgi:hypothetical protein
MEPDDTLCWLCDDPLTLGHEAASWQGFEAHRDCVRRQTGDSPDAPTDPVIGTTT